MQKLWFDSVPNRIPDAAVRDLTPLEHARQPLLAEIPGLTVDVEKLNWHLQNVVKKFAPIYVQRDPIRAPMRKYGGWSVTSASGSVHDGWQSQSGWNGGGKFDSTLAYQAGYRPRWLHTKKTEICTGYLNEVHDMVADMGFYPVATRIWENPPGGYHIGQHTDGPNGSYSVRLHIPIVTNPDCVHIWYTKPKEFATHLPADGRAWLFRTNISHDTYNYGTTERHHLIFEAWDTKGVVPEFKFDHIDRVRSSAETWMQVEEQKQQALNAKLATDFEPDSMYKIKE